MKAVIFVALLCALVSACRTSSGMAEASPNHFKWYVDEFWGGDNNSFEQIDMFADRHCQKYGKRAIKVPRTKEIEWLKYLNYVCVPKDKYICKYQLFSSVPEPCGDFAQNKNKHNNEQPETNTTSVAEDKCVGLGFKQGTEKFGDCVLQLSK
jgi:hypothetical protein